MRNKLAAILFAFAAVLMGVLPCEAKRDTLVVALTNITTLDMTSTNTRQSLNLYHNWGDTLVYRDPIKKKIVPCLARSYRFLGPNVIEFKLRKGVRFHNGEPFNAHSVKFSADLVKDSQTFVRSFFDWIKEVVVVDEHTIQLRCSVPNVVSLEAVANMLCIYPPTYYSRVGKEEFGKHPVGTGPYRFVSWDTPTEIVFEANPDYFGSPKCIPKIPRLKILIRDEEILRVKSLVSGKADLVRFGSVSPDHLLFLKQEPGLKVLNISKLRTFFIMLDSLGRSGVDYFKDKRVRRAFNYAINKERIIKDVLKGYPKVSHSATNPLQFGHEPDVRTYPYDPVKARRLLAEAGYPKGFDIDFYVSCTESVAEEVSEDLNAVGIKTKIIWMGGKWDIMYEKLRSGAVPMALINWGSYSIFDAASILNPFFKIDEPLCYGSTPNVCGMLRKAEKVQDQEERKVLFSKAQKLIAEEAFWVPLFYGNGVGVMKRDLNFLPAYDEIDRYFNAFWEK